MTEGFLYRRLAQPIFELLRQGVTPEKIALSVALGAAFGVFPAIGVSTTLCAIAALFLGLNLPAIQIANYFVYPVQIALLLPFFRMGEKLFHASHLPISVEQIHRMIHGDVWGAMRLLWATTWHAIAVWCLIAPVFVAFTYAILAPALRYKMSRISS
jgi:uncharacterized protein (DUF2062 family)